MRKFMRSNFSAFVYSILAFALIAFSGVPAFAADSVEYVERSVDANGNVVSQTRTATNYTTLASATKNWQDNWYYAYGKISINSKVTVSGDVHLILKKGCTLTATEGIYVQEGSSLTIYGQHDGDGKLIATGDSG